VGITSAPLRGVLDTGFHDEGYGYDLFGMHPRWVRRALRWLEPLHARYFRVRSHGVTNIPLTGPAILVANHSGTLPVDAVMLWTDVARRTGRVARLIGDWFIPVMPIIGTIAARCGAVTGTRTNAGKLLERGELIAIFPEGTTGMAKPPHERYHLQEWRVGHAELGIRYRAPIVPIAIVGAEEAWPAITRLRMRPFGAPFVPIPATPLPMPVRFDIHYGTPLVLHRELPRDAADDPARVEAAAQRTRAAVDELLARARAARRPS